MPMLTTGSWSPSRPAGTGGFGITQCSGMGLGRVTTTLRRLEQGGRSSSEWEPNPGSRPHRRLYSIVPEPDVTPG